ncbi:hypothetical protein ACP3QT_04110, partial [Acinetobacter baumannii]
RNITYKYAFSCSNKWDHLFSDNNHLEEKWVWQALRQMVFLEGPYLMGESRATYEQLLESLGPSDLFASLSSLKDE